MSIFAALLGLLTLNTKPQNPMNRYLVITKTARRFIVMAQTPEAAQARIETKQVHKCPWTGKTVLTEEGIPVEKVVAM